MELIARSGSWEKGGEQARQKHLEAVVEQAGCEIKKEPEPTLEQRLIDNYAPQARSAAERHPDWNEVVGQSDIKVGRPAQLAVLEKQNGAEIVHHLAVNPVLATTIGEMKPADAVAAIHRLSDELETKASFAEIAGRPWYPRKMRDLRAAQRRR